MDNKEFSDRIKPVIEQTAEKLYNHFRELGIEECSYSSDLTASNVNGFIEGRVNDCCDDLYCSIDFREEEEDLQDFLYDNESLQWEVNNKIAEAIVEWTDPYDDFGGDDYGYYQYN